MNKMATRQLLIAVVVLGYFSRSTAICKQYTPAFVHMHVAPHPPHYMNLPTYLLQIFMDKKSTGICINACLL